MRVRLSINRGQELSIEFSIIFDHSYNPVSFDAVFEPTPQAQLTHSHMKSSQFLRVFLTLAMSLGFLSTQLFSQKESNPGNSGKETERPRQGGGGQRGGGPGGGGGQNTANLSPEERLKRINEMIQRNVVEMAELVEIREDQQEAFVKAHANFEVQSIRVRGQMQQAGQDREKRMDARQKMQKLFADTNKSMKGILDKAQFKAYQEKMKERMPQRGQGGGRQR